MGSCPRRPRHRSRSVPSSAFAGYRFPPEVITLAVRWYLPFGLSYRDVEELLGERGIDVDHVTIYRWVQRFSPEFAQAAQARRHIVGDRWHVDETYVKVGGTWRYLFRAIDQFGQVIDVFLSRRRNAEAARRFFAQALERTGISPTKVTTDRYRLYPRLVDDDAPHGHPPDGSTCQQRPRDRPRPPESTTPADAPPEAGPHRQVIVAGHAFIQNLRRGFYDLGTDAAPAGLPADVAATVNRWLGNDGPIAEAKKSSASTNDLAHRQ
jgi:transposase, IS6 family